MRKNFKSIILGSFLSILFSTLISCNSNTHNHRWTDISYTWSDDNSTCTACRVCLDDVSHKEEEISTSTYSVVVEPTCGFLGKGRYTANFINKNFVNQTKEVDIEKTNHIWDEGTITTFPTINSDGIRTFRCLNCSEVRIEAIDKVVDLSNYTLDAIKMDKNLPGVYEVKANVGDNKANNTIGIAEIAKQNLVDYPTYETPAIIQGAAVNYEIKKGPVEYEPIPGATLTAPYEYFRYTITEVQSTSADGEITTYKKLSGFDGTYYIIRVDVSNIIKDRKDGYLHVKQENNKALMVAMGVQTTLDTNNELITGSFADGMGIKTASYSLKDDFKALKDTTGNYTTTPYLDVIVLSSGKLAAGADKGKETAPTADISLSFYVDNEGDHNPSLNYDPVSTDPNHNIEVAKKYFDETKAVEGTNATSYLVKGDDFEIDCTTIESVDDDNIDEYWSLTKALDYQQYNEHTVKLLCEVPVLEGLVVESRVEEPRKMVLDVNSFDIQIANHSQTDVAGLVIKNNASLEILDNSNTVGAELAIGNNAKMEIQDGGTFIVDQTCQLEVEYDAASIVHDTQHYSIEEVEKRINELPPLNTITEIHSAQIIAAMDAYNNLTPEEKEKFNPELVIKLESYVRKLEEITTALNNGEITVKNGGTLINEGIVSIEGLEVKPGGGEDPATHTIVMRDMKAATLLVEQGGVLENYGCLSIKGDLYILGTLNNYGKYNDLIEATDPDKGTVNHHKGIQLFWKDDVTIKVETPEPHYEVNPDVKPGKLHLGKKGDEIINDAILNNYGDIVLAPGVLEVYGSFYNHKDLGFGTGYLYLCEISEAVVPIVPTKEDPTKLEERRQFTPPYPSKVDVVHASKYEGNGRVFDASIEILFNGAFGNLVPIILP